MPSPTSILAGLALGIVATQAAVYTRVEQNAGKSFFECVCSAAEVAGASSDGASRRARDP